MLERINGLSDLKKLNIKQLPELCEEIRSKLLQTVLNNGGHLASNLGVVELTVALHYVFDDTDKIVWDVGHQSYVHKMLTGRLSEIDTLRQSGGLSGFTDVKESEYDSFGAGHASTAISAALGIAKARDISNQNFDVVAVVGDGALTGGLSYEGLNSIGNTKMFIVLNDNNMSIGDNVGSATKNLSKMRISKGYINFKRRTKKFLSKVPLVGKPLLRLGTNIARNMRLKRLHNIYFENFNIKYVGPANGHDVKELVFYLSKIKNNIDKPTVLHCLTKKGKGYEAAEKDPQKYHGVSPKNSKSNCDMSETVGRTLKEIAVDNPKITVITAAMADGTGTSVFKDAYPQRFFDVGIAEEHAVTFAAGLAMQGLKPYVAVYSTFLQRAYDQIVHDVCLQNLPVTFCIDRAGLVGQDGKTHQGLFDIPFLSSIPNITLLAPATVTQLKQMLTWSVSQSGPIAIRYPKYSLKSCEETACDFVFPRWNLFGDVSSDVYLFAVGCNALSACLNVKRVLENKKVCVINACCIKPLDYKTLGELKLEKKTIVTAEEGVLCGGFGSLIDSYIVENNIHPKKVIHMGVKDYFVSHATIEEQIEAIGITEKGIMSAVIDSL